MKKQTFDDSEQRGEAGGTEMGVLAQGLAQPQLPHDDESEAVGEGKALGDVLDEKALRFLKSMKISPPIDLAVHFFVAQRIAFHGKISQRIDGIVGFDSVFLDRFQPGDGLSAAGQDDALPFGYLFQGRLSVLAEFQQTYRLHP